MSCPVCRIQYTKEIAVDQVTGKATQNNSNLMKILGNIHVLYCHQGPRSPVVATHYVIKPDTFNVFRPRLETEDDNGEPMVLYTRKQ